MADPKTVKVKARDVVPYLYGFWSSKEGPCGARPPYFYIA